MVAVAPIPTFRSASSPYPILTSLAYVQSTLGGNFLPVLGGEVSNLVSFRIYNNFGLTPSVTTMDNLFVTVYDGPTAASHTQVKSVVNQSWIRIYETGYGESKVAPGVYTQFYGQDTAIGKAGTDKYTPEVGSAGTTTPSVRAGTDGNGLGFIEFATYAELPEVVGFASYSFSVSVVYDWIT